MDAKKLLKSKKTTIALVAVTVTFFTIGFLGKGGNKSEAVKVVQGKGKNEPVGLLKSREPSRLQANSPSGSLVFPPEGATFNEGGKQGVKENEMPTPPAFPLNEGVSENSSKSVVVGMQLGSKKEKADVKGTEKGLKASQTVTAGTAVGNSLAGSSSSSTNVTVNGLVNGLTGERKGETEKVERKPLYAFYTKEEFEKACKELFSTSKKSSSTAKKARKSKSRLVSNRKRGNSRKAVAKTVKRKRFAKERRVVVKRTKREGACSNEAKVRSVVVSMVGKASGIVCKDQGTSCVLFVGGKKYEKGDFLKGYEIEKVTLEGVTLKDANGSYKFLKAEEILNGSL